MSLKVGIVGLPNVGKSTLFKAITKNPVDINNYPFCTIEPNIGIVEVPDERLWKLSEVSRSKKTIPAIVEFVDIAGLVKGASEGEGLGNKFLANIREVDAIVQVVRVFQDAKITHVHNHVDPVRDREVVNTELILADLETVRKTKERLEKESRSGNKEAILRLHIAHILEQSLDEGVLANESPVDRGDETTTKFLRELSLLTAKPFIYVYNVSDFDAKLPESLISQNYVKIDIKIEEELLEMTPEEIRELGLQTNLSALIRKAYEILGLITYFTTGEDESRAWTIRLGSTAPRAGAAIHGDFEQKFIRAEVIQWDELLSLGSWGRARESGKLRTEGKEYIVQDGDVIEFKV